MDTTKQLITAHAATIEAYARLLHATMPWITTEQQRIRCIDYVEWCSQVAEAVLANIDQRGWTTLGMFLRSFRTSELDAARSNPIQGPRRMPTLLAASFRQICLFQRLANAGVQFVTVDLSHAIRIGIMLLGDEEATNLDNALREQALIAALLVRSDSDKVGADSLKVPPKSVPTAILTEYMGAKSRPAFDARMVGHWLYEEFYGGGHTAVHLVLLPNGNCVRTSRTVASLSFRDSDGNWAGAMDLASKVRAEDRGRWSFVKGLLSLEMDDDSSYEYAVAMTGSSMVTTNTTSGERRLWNKVKL